MGTGRSGIARGTNTVGKKVSGGISAFKDKVVQYLEKQSEGGRYAYLVNNYLKYANMDRELGTYAVTNNCQRVCYAVDQLLEGNFVEALHTKRGDNAGSMFGADSYRNVYENATWDDFQSKDISAYEAHIKSLLPNSGDKAIVGVFWNSGGGHLFNAINIGGRVYGIDGQTGLNYVFPLSKYTNLIKTNSNMDVLVTSDSTYKTTELAKKFIKKNRSAK